MGIRSKKCLAERKKDQEPGKREKRKNNKE